MTAQQIAPLSLQATKSSVQSYWDMNVSNWKVASSDVGTEAYFRQVESYRFSKLKYLSRVVPFDCVSGKRLLDVGCGLGTDLSKFVTAGANGVGVDMSAAAIDLAIKNFSWRGIEAEFYQMDGEALAFADNSFDLVYCHTVLHFTPDPKAMVREIYRVLKPGGMAILMTVNRRSWLYFLHRMVNLKIDYLDAPVFNKYSIKEFKAMMDCFDQVKIVVERFPVRTEVHSGIAALLYNILFVDIYNAMPKWLVGKTGYHLLAFASKTK